MNKVIVKYEHHGKDVLVDASAIGLHRAVCLCYTGCKHYNPESREDNCPISNAVYANCVEHGIVSPIWECPKYESTEEITIMRAILCKDLVVGEKYFDHHPELLQQAIDEDPMKAMFAGMFNATPCEMEYKGTMKRMEEVVECECECGKEDCEGEKEEGAECEDAKPKMEEVAYHMFAIEGEEDDINYNKDEETGLYLFESEGMDDHHFYQNN